MTHMKHTLLIKNMVCPRCITMVTKIMRQSGFELNHIELGALIIKKQRYGTFEKMVRRLNRYGFELITDPEEWFVERTKIYLLEYLKKIQEQDRIIILSEFLEVRLLKDYNYIADLFLSLEDISVTDYFSLLKFERTKELISYDELTLHEVARLLNFYDAAQLADEFYINMAISYTEFREKAYKYRKSLDGIHFSADT